MLDQFVEVAASSGNLRWEGILAAGGAVLKRKPYGAEFKMLRITLLL